jgi:hypothetical protein
VEPPCERKRRVNCLRLFQGRAEPPSQISKILHLHSSNSSSTPQIPLQSVKKPVSDCLRVGCLQTSSEHFGRHAEVGGKCRCADLYGGGFGQGLVPHPDWPDDGPFKETPGKADFGCRWFVEWEALVAEAFALDQTAIVICADPKGRDTVLRMMGRSWEGMSGVGHSQKAELAYLLGKSKLTVSIGTCEDNPIADRL